MSRAGSRLLLAVLMVLGFLPSVNAYSQNLDADAKKAIATFGEGTVVPVAGDMKIENAEDYLGFEPGTKTYKVASGQSEGEIVKRTVKKKADASNTFVVTLGKLSSMTLVAKKDGVFLTTEVDPSTSSLSTFEPNEIILLSNMKQGEKKTRTIQVKVHDVSQPTVVTHTGSLDCVYEVLGAFKITTPAGTFDAVGIRTRYNGSVGPASVKDSNYLFFAKGVGPVAMRFRSRISAFLFYNKNEKRSLVLEKK